MTARSCPLTNNCMSDPKLEQGLLGVSWNVSHEDLESAHPGGNWNRRTEAGTAYLEYSVKSPGKLFGTDLVAHLPLKFIFDIDGDQPLKGLSCWLRAIGRGARDRRKNRGCMWAISRVQQTERRILDAVLTSGLCRSAAIEEAGCAT